jgi:hypothetical protein
MIQIKENQRLFFISQKEGKIPKEGRSLILTGGLKVSWETNGGTRIGSKYLL